MGMNVGKRSGIQPSMNVTPLVDVVLVLLIIFMVVTPLLAKQMSVRVPEKSSAEPSNDVPIVVMVKNDGSIELNRAAISEDALAVELEKIGDKIVFFAAEDQVTYGAAVAVLDRAKQSGATVAVLTEQPK